MEDFAGVLPGIQKNVPLKEFTTYKLGGPADYFFVAETTESAMKILKAAQERNMPTLVIGGGSNLLVSDAGFRGLVVKIAIAGKPEITGNAITVGAGVSMDEAWPHINASQRIYVFHPRAWNPIAVHNLELLIKP